MVRERAARDQYCAIMVLYVRSENSSDITPATCCGSMRRENPKGTLKFWPHTLRLIPRLMSLRRVPEDFCIRFNFKLAAPDVWDALKIAGLVKSSTGQLHASLRCDRDTALLLTFTIESVSWIRDVQLTVHIAWKCEENSSDDEIFCMFELYFSFSLFFFT